MILSTQLSRRFMRLFVPFITYAAPEVGIDYLDTLDPDAGEDVADLCERVWGPGGRRDLISAFVADNPARFNRTDLREIERWEQGVFGTFDIVRDKTDVFYLLGGYAFAVRGMSDEADHIDGYPVTRVRSILLPIDTVVTYGISIEDPAGMGLGREVRDKALADARAERRLVRTARQFMDKAPDFLAAAMDAARQGQVPLPQHAGSLAGLTWKERQDAIADALDGPIKGAVLPILRENIDEVLVSGPPTASMAEILGRYRRDTLAGIADAYGLTLSRRTTKASYVEAIMDAMPKEADVFCREALLQGEVELNRLLDIFEAGGRITAADDDVDALKVFPTQAFLAVAFFRERDSYVAVVPDVVSDALAAADLDALRKRARTIDVCYRYASLSAQFRGVVPIQEVGDDCEGLGLENPTDIVYAIAARRNLMDAVCDFVVVDDGHYLACSQIAENSVGHGRLRPRYERLVRDIMAAHNRMGRRALADLVREHDYREEGDYLHDQEAYRDLARYLDAHVPEGSFDLQFADVVLERLSDVCNAMPPASITTEALMPIVDEYGLVVAGEDLGVFNQLLAAFIDVVPNWYNNGWPATHARE